MGYRLLTWGTVAIRHAAQVLNTFVVFFFVLEEAMSTMEIFFSTTFATTDKLITQQLITEENKL